MQRLWRFFKKEFVFTAAALLALLSMLAVPPDLGYGDYIDWRVLGVLFCLMAVVAGFLRAGVFSVLSRQVLSLSGSLRLLSALLVGLCFFSAMLVTNDVALITFVPLTLAMLKAVSQLQLVYTVVLETVAANLGSMLTPVGNPQNLYLYSYYEMSLPTFLQAVAPLCACSLLLLGLLLLLRRDTALPRTEQPGLMALDKRRFLMYLALFLLSLLTVVRLVDFRICLAVTVAVLLWFDRGIFRRVDYVLLGTFLAFFVFVGNLGRIPAVEETLSGLVAGRELLTGALISQIVSNVPAAIMLSGFTENGEALLQGVNLGGLGTLVASLANLIAYKLYAGEKGARPGMFLAVFTAVNFGLLAVLGAFCLWVA